MTTIVLNLTENPGCYTNPISNNIETIYKYATDDITSLGELVDWIIKLIEPAYFNKDAKPRFIHRLRNCRTKKAVLQLCLNAVANAVEYEVVA
jgi:hypothetical protein